MKLMRFAAVLAALLTLSSCVGQKEADINIFTERLNSDKAFSLSADGYRITSENERYRYSQMADGNTIICIYTERDGIVVQCTLTTVKNDSIFRNRCAAAVRSFLLNDKESCSKLTDSAFRNGSVISDGYKLTVIDSEVGITFLINRSDDELNTNESPTLKKHIDKKDITRPTLGAEKTDAQN